MRHEAVAIDRGARSMPIDLQRLRVLVVHEWLYVWGGAERCLAEILHVLPRADLVVGSIVPEFRGFNGVTQAARETWLGKLPGSRSHHRWFLPLQAAAFSTLDTSEYDLVISSSHAFAKAVRARASAFRCRPS